MFKRGVEPLSYIYSPSPLRRGVRGEVNLKRDAKQNRTSSKLCLTAPVYIHSIVSGIANLAGLALYAIPPEIEVVSLRLS